MRYLSPCSSRRGQRSRRRFEPLSQPNCVAFKRRQGLRFVPLLRDTIGAIATSMSSRLPVNVRTAEKLGTAALAEEHLGEDQHRAKSQKLERDYIRQVIAVELELRQAALLFRESSVELSPRKSIATVRHARARVTSRRRYYHQRPRVQNGPKLWPK